MLLLSLVTLLVALPLFALTPGGEMRFSILLCLVLGAAVYVNSTERWTFVVTALIGVASILGRFAARRGDTSKAQEHYERALSIAAAEPAWLSYYVPDVEADLAMLQGAGVESMGGAELTD